MKCFLGIFLSVLIFIIRELRIIPREEWNALPPINITKLELPSTRVIIGHTVTGNCFEKVLFHLKWHLTTFNLRCFSIFLIFLKSDCAIALRTMQEYHMNQKLDDIAYNFLVGGDGAVYVGRGWDVRGEHTYGYNAKSIGIAFVGTFINRAPPKRQLIAAQKIIEKGVELKKLSADYKLYGQRQMKSTESPGDELYKIILTWKHWSAEVSEII